MSFYATYHDPAALGGSYEGFEARAAQDFPEKLRLVCEAVPPPARLLDVGCAKGGFLLEAKELGYDVAGIDVSNTAVQQARQRLGISIRLGQLAEQDDWHGHFDVVCLLATIEHVPDPSDVLCAVNRVLRPNGLLLLDTGIAGDFCDRYAPGSTQWYNAPEHLYVFSRRGLAHLLEVTGFRVDRIECCFERSAARKLARGLRNWAASAAGHVLWRLLLGKRGLERLRLDVKLPFGNLMLAMARKRAV